MFDKAKALEYILKIAQSKGVSQMKLCENIYDYSHFNRMCNGKEPINLEVLFMCADKLSIDYSVLEKESERLNERKIEHYFDEFRCCVQTHNIHGLEKLFQEISSFQGETTKLFQLKRTVNAFLLWEHEQDYKNAIRLLQEALLATIPKFDLNTISYQALSEFEMNIVNDLSVCYFDSGDYETCMLILNHLIEEGENGYHNDIWLRSCFNASLFHLKLANLDKSISYSNRGIMKSKETYNYLYLFYFYYNKAIASFRKGDIDNFLEAIVNGFHLSEYQNKKVFFLNILKEDIKKYQIESSLLENMPFW